MTSYPVNPYESEFLSLVLNNNLIILNGRTLGDLSGSFTCIKPNGSSVVDYFMVSKNIADNVKLLEVLAFTPYSDHKPLLLTLPTQKLNLSISRPLREIYDSAPSKFLFDDNSLINFIDLQNTEGVKCDLAAIKQKMTTLTENSSQREDITKLNNDYTNYLHKIANSCFKISKKVSIKQARKNKPWFNWNCKTAKRQISRAARATSNHGDSAFLRMNYYHIKKFYETLINRHKKSFFDKMNRDIEEGKILNWQQFKKLKQYKDICQNFDSLDMENFESFFSSLYADEHLSIDEQSKENLLTNADCMNSCNLTTDDILNSPITYEETRGTISALKKGKASSDDMIANELLKSLNYENTLLLTDLFNICLEKGVYPWNNNIITPLHKKGCKDNPDNYRAISVSSGIGKLLSTILLDRFIKFRQTSCPDSLNQLAFTKKAQTYDHVLTMQTISSKYKKLKKPVFAIFVDFRKAFDTVCRQALFFKLAQSKATGRFYNILRDMYTNSKGQIKLAGYLSKCFDINKGTEQGHPLSPDLFKHYLGGLSSLLEFENCPQLASLIISHLLWADDLIMLSLDKETAQKQLDALHNFCHKWGLEVNMDKTKVMITGHEPKGLIKPNFKLGNMNVKYTDEYCYLGLVLNKSGSLKTAQTTLKTKAMRAFFGLKGTVNKSKISFRAQTTLFDSLIKPIALYGAPIWLPTSSIIKNISSLIINNRLENSPTFKFTNRVSQMPCEKVHLSFLK